MALEFTLDLTGETPETIEAGSQVPPGWYHNRVEDVYEDEKNPGGTVFKYKTLGGNGGAWDARYIFDRLGSPAAADSENGAEFLRRRTKLLAKRLGLLDDACIRAGGQVELDWHDAIGREVVLHIAKRSYDERDKTTGQRTGNRRETVGVAFDGVYPVGGYPADKLPRDCPTDMRQLISGGGPAPAAPSTPAAPAARAAAAATPGTPAPAAPRAQADGFDFSDL
jgi:hypothetical protein